MSAVTSRLFLHPQITQMDADEKTINKNLRQSVKSADNTNKLADHWYRRKQVFMQDWAQKLNEFLDFNEKPVLPNAGTASKAESIKVLEDTAKQIEKNTEDEK